MLSVNLCRYAKVISIHGCLLFNQIFMHILCTIRLYDVILNTINYLIISLHTK